MTYQLMFSVYIVAQEDAMQGFLTVYRLSGFLRLYHTSDPLRL